MFQKVFGYLTFTGVALLSVAPALAQQQQRSGYGYHMWDSGWHGLFFGPIMMIAFIAVAVVVVILLVRWLGGVTHGHPQQVQHNEKSPLDILKERYAKGEIDKEEFEERRRILGE